MLRYRGRVYALGGLIAQAPSPHLPVCVTAIKTPLVIEFLESARAAHEFCYADPSTPTEHLPVHSSHIAELEQVIALLKEVQP